MKLKLYSKDTTNI